MLLLNIDLLYAWKHHTPSRPNCSCETLEMKHSIQHSLQNYEKNYTWICIKIALKIHYTCKYSATIENLLIYILAHTVCTCTLAFYCETKKKFDTYLMICFHEFSEIYMSSLCVILYHEQSACVPKSKKKIHLCYTQISPIIHNLSYIYRLKFISQIHS